MYFLANFLRRVLVGTALSTKVTTTVDTSSANPIHITMEVRATGLPAAAAWVKYPRHLAGERFGVSGFHPLQTTGGGEGGAQLGE
ncbi:hypothetical protein [Pleomorphomonas sp. PLEO]|uniref:hypothetical protein n=1 Tax=Pleomorphomonas sp. PLEO TaxID=3239306 RepID=UPI00351EC1DD